VCTKILRLLDEPKHPGLAYKPVLGTPNEVVHNSTCTEHRRLLIETIPSGLLDDSYDEIQALAVHNTPGVTLQYERKGKGGRAQSSYPLCLLSRPNESSQESMGKGRRINARWIDKRLLKTWKQTCDRFHGQSCSGSPLASHFHSVRPQWLIDVWQLCLVLASPPLSYIALSYVWGITDCFTTLQKNVDQLKLPNSLSLSNKSIRLAKTIRNAMQVVELLNERYLWADQLCIVQDDEEHKNKEILKMGAIFSNASITIIAADGVDADSGLKGLRGLSDSRHIDQKIFRLGKGKDLVEVQSRDGSYSRSLWFSRGWTFQELLLSQRRLIFEETGIRWECSQASWQEDLHSSPAVDKEGLVYAIGPRMVSYSLPNVASLVKLIKDYNLRQFTYPQDALAAFTGVLSVLRPSFSGGFISGLPKAFFNHALLWLNNRSSSRRYAKAGTVENVCLPSWSWVGWHGDFDSDNWITESEFQISLQMRSIGRLSVTSSVRWYFSRTPQGSWTEISCDWDGYRQQFLDSDAHMPPPGWTRHKAPVGKIPLLWHPIHVEQLGHSPRWIYTHKSLPDAEFWHPVSLSNPEDDLYVNIMAPYIACQTRRSFLFGGNRLSTDRLCIALHDQEGNWVGALNLDQEPLCDDQGGQTSDYLTGQRFELAEIAEGSKPNKARWGWPLDEWKSTERPKNTDYYQFYYVMCIDWNGDVAYRIGLGRVGKEAWDALNTESIDVVLG
jgi:Heterokaryon incompatibility protein (HET)